MARAKGDADGVAARIAPGIGIDAYETERLYLNTSLLQRLAPARLLDRLSDLDEAAGQGIAAGKWGTAAADEQHPRVRIEDHAISG
jgi:hypothetical protein